MSFFTSCRFAYHETLAAEWLTRPCYGTRDGSDTIPL